MFYFVYTLGYDLCFVLFFCVFVFIFETHVVFISFVEIINICGYMVLIWEKEVMVVKYLFNMILVFCCVLFCFGYGFKCIIILLLSLLNVHVLFIFLFLSLFTLWFSVLIFHSSLMFCYKTVCDMRLILTEREMWIQVVQMGWGWYMSINGIAMILNDKNEMLMASVVEQRNERL